MNLKQLRAFTEVVSTGSVSEAARRLHRSQPSVSGLIASLEQELGLELFTRTGMRLKPAPEAYFLLREANEILHRVDNARKTMQSVRDSTTGELELASMPGPTIYLLPSVIDRFLGKREDIRVRLITRSSSEVEQIVSTQRAEMGFADYELLETYDDELVAFEIFDFPCWCAMRSDDPLARKSLITPADLDGQRLATLYPEHPTTTQLERVFDSFGATMDTCFVAQYFVPLFTFVERPRVYSLIDSMSVECYFSQHEENARRLAFRRFEPGVNLCTAVITPKHRPMSMLAQQFLEVFRSQLSSIQTRDYTCAPSMPH